MQDSPVSPATLFAQTDEIRRPTNPLTMKAGTSQTYPCSVCGASFGRRRLAPAESVRETITSLIQRDHPAWTPTGFICADCVARYRAEYVRTLLASEKGELTSLEEEVLNSLKHHDMVATNVDAEFEQRWTFGERLADHIATFGGSWAFLICFGTFLVLWIIANSLVLWLHPPDPYPFILLNLILSCLAAVQAPVIMMSQNRQEAKDRLRSQHDYQVNLKAELEIRHLHEKIDHLLSHQWERLVEIQQLQLDLLAELNRRRS